MAPAAAIIHPQTIAALIHFGYHDTAEFLQIVANIRDFLGNCSKFKGNHLRKEMAMPIENKNDWRATDWLQTCISWIDT